MDALEQLSFTSETERGRVVFGAGMRDELPAALDALGLVRPLVLSTPGRSTTLAEIALVLERRAAGVCDVAALHVPADRVRAAVAAVDRLRPDALLAVGGGSAIGLAKATAMDRPLPIVAVPTTYSGSEMTSIWGVTGGDEKRTGRATAVAPCLVVYDPDLTIDLPVAVSASSGMNAVAHAVEALYAVGAPMDAVAAAMDALRSLAAALPRIVETPRDLAARTRALYGAHRAGVALELASMGLHHKICHVLGGSFGLPHADTHAVVLPHVVRFNAPAAPEAMGRIAEALGAEDAVLGVTALGRSLGLTRTLRDLGLRAEDLARAAARVAAASYPNPRPATAADVEAILRAAR
jgi:maleylacetate reductase